MKSVRILVVAAFAAALTACGGGGGSDSVAVTPPVVTPPVVTPPVVTPPVVNPPVVNPPVVNPAPVTTVTASIAAGAVVDPGAVNQGLLIQFSGAVKPASAIYNFTQNGNMLFGALVPKDATNTAMVFTPSVRAGYGQNDVFTMDIADANGNPIHVEVKFATSAMSCTSNSVWSNPAVFSSALGDCVAPIGVQAIASTTANKMQDTSCTLNVGAKAPAECQKYAANGTLLFADTSIVVNNNPVLWVVYFQSNGTSSLALVDKTTQVVIGTMSTSPDIQWIIGNPTGAAVRIGSSTYQVAWNGSAITRTCAAGC